MACLSRSDASLHRLVALLRALVECFQASRRSDFDDINDGRNLEFAGASKNDIPIDLRITRNMIRKLKSGQFRLYSRKKNAETGKRRNLGTFSTLEQAKQHEREVQYFKKH